MRLSKKMEEQLEVIGKTYDVWFKIWRDTYFPRLIHQPIWFKTHCDLVVGDLVNFLKRDSAVGDIKWTMGMWRTSTEEGMVSCGRPSSSIY